MSFKNTTSGMNEDSPFPIETVEVNDAEMAQLALDYIAALDKTPYVISNAQDPNNKSYYQWTGSDWISWINSGPGAVVESVTGDGVDNTDPINPILTFPTPSEIGLGNVDNTSDADKPISTATQTGLDSKEDAFAKNTAFNKDFGTAAGEVLEGDTPTITPTQSGNISTNNAKISFPEAPNDGQEYVRKSLAWSVPSGGGGGGSQSYCCPFGAKSDSTSKFLIANGKSTEADDSTKPRTRQPILDDGKLIKLGYKTKEADSNTKMKIHINGVVEATVNLTNINANFGGVEVIDVDVVEGDYVEIEYDSNQKPGECTMYFKQELT